VETVFLLTDGAPQPMQHSGVTAIEQHLHIAADRACRDVRAGDEKASMNNGKPQ